METRPLRRPRCPCSPSHTGQPSERLCGAALLISSPFADPPPSSCGHRARGRHSRVGDPNGHGTDKLNRRTNGLPKTGDARVTLFGPTITMLFPAEAAALAKVWPFPPAGLPTTCSAPPLRVNAEVALTMLDADAASWVKSSARLPALTAVAPV